jgi:uncharacterized protein
MKRIVFADAVYWIALAHTKDQWHARSVSAGQSLQGVEIVTTDEVLTEFLTFFSEHGRLLRTAAIRYVEGVLNDPNITVLPQTHQTFLLGVTFYKARPDKEYSLTDCVSMVAMRQEGIADVLSHDAHFSQEGFTLLL